MYGKKREGQTYVISSSCCVPPFKCDFPGLLSARSSPSCFSSPGTKPIPGAEDPGEPRGLPGPSLPLTTCPLRGRRLRSSSLPPEDFPCTSQTPQRGFALLAWERRPVWLGEHLLFMKLITPSAPAGIRQRLSLIPNWEYWEKSDHCPGSGPSDNRHLNLPQAEGLDPT